MNQAKLVERIVFSDSAGKEMKKIRLELGTTQKDLAKKLGITQSTLSDYEAGRRKNPGTNYVKRFVEEIQNK